MIIAINLINNAAQEVTTVVFAQGVNQKNEARKICCFECSVPQTIRKFFRYYLKALGKFHCH